MWKGFGDDLARRIARSPALAGLSSLEMSLSSLTMAGVDDLAALSRLHALDAHDHALERMEAVHLLQRLPQVTELGLGRLSGSLSDVLARLLEAPEVVRLTRLGLSSLSDEDLARIASAAGLARLDSLDLGSCPKATAAGLRALAQSPHFRLRTFSVVGHQLGNAGISALADGPALAEVRELSLTQCGLDRHVFPTLLSFPALERVVLGHNRMPPDTREQLAAVPEVIFDRRR